MKVLVVEDDALLMGFIQKCLEQSGFDVDTADDGERGFMLAKKNQYDVIVLDIALPRMQGTEICLELRKLDIMSSIIFLSSFSTKDDRVNGLEIGADDYLTKPFSHDELIARVKALTRRPAHYSTKAIRQGDFLIDTTSKEVFVRGTGVRLTPKEFQLLAELARYPNKVVTREYLLQRVWGVELGNTSNRLEVCIRSLRSKLSIRTGHDYIITEYGVGYRLEQ